MRRSLYPLLAFVLVACDRGGPIAPQEDVDPSAAADVAAETDIDAEPAEAAPASAEFALGTHYRRLSPVQPTSSGPGRVEITALFVHREAESYELEPHLERLDTRLPPYLSLVRVPAVRNAIERLHARAYFAADALGRRADVHAALFRELQVVGNPLDSRAAIADLFASLGIGGTEFDAAFDSYGVHALVQNAEELTRRYRLETAPTLAVNGKYTSTPTLAGGYAELIALVDFLAAAERTAR